MKRSALFLALALCLLTVGTLGINQPSTYAGEKDLNPTKLIERPSNDTDALNDLLVYKAPWLICAKVKAADASLGYDCEGDGIFCTQFVYECLKESGLDLKDTNAGAEGSPSSQLGDQQDALLECGFIKKKIASFEDIPAGSVIYAYGSWGGPRHVEFYLGTYDLKSLDVNGNPAWSETGTPLTIGARITDRDPAPGDQLQTNPNAWFGGEVGAFDRFSRGEDYWTYAYIPGWLINE